MATVGGNLPGRVTHKPGFIPLTGTGTPGQVPGPMNCRDTVSPWLSISLSISAVIRMTSRR